MIFFYICYNDLDKYVIEHYDNMFGINQIEILGKVWGLHYVYEFLHYCGLISEKHYRLMIENLAFLKREFLLVLSDNLWKMRFVAKWPKSDANLLNVPAEVFNKNSVENYNKNWEYLNSILPNLPEFERIEKEIDKDSNKRENIFPFDEVLNKMKDGQFVRTEPQTGRNDPCPCGSGKKFKNCCLNK